MRLRLLVTLTCWVIAASGVAGHGPLAADDVYLTNGRTFEGVIAELTPTQVRIRLADGELRLPRAQVLRIEEAETPHERYLRQAQDLRASAATTPREWLGLARWARVNGLEPAAREAALVAADLAPELEGLAPLLRGLGYTLDQESASWMPHGEYMRNLGYVQHQGEWTTPEEQAGRLRAESVRRQQTRAAVEEALRLRREEEREQAELARAVVAELRYQTGDEPARSAAPYVPFIYSVPAPVFVVRRGGVGAYFHVPSPVHPPLAPPAVERGRFDPTPGPTMSIYERAPGSLIPARGRF